MGVTPAERSAIVAELEALRDNLQPIARAALQTRLLALDALLEARRCDSNTPDGALVLIADAVQDLAARIESAMIRIGRSVDALQSNIQAVPSRLEPEAPDAGITGAP